MKNLGMTVELDPKGDKRTFPTFGLYSSPAEHSTMGHIVLDLTSLAHQPTTKSHGPLPRQSEDQPIKMRMTNHLCDQHQGRNLL